MRQYIAKSKDVDVVENIYCLIYLMLSLKLVVNEVNPLNSVKLLILLFGSQVMKDHADILCSYFFLVNRNLHLWFVYENHCSHKSTYTCMHTFTCLDKFIIFSL